MQCLYKSDYKSHKDRNPERVPGTCEWLLQDEMYLRWWEEQKSSLLWVSADAGCGKSVLAKFLVENLSSPNSQQAVPSTVCYFFFKDDSDDQKNAIFALCALLHQLFVARKPLVCHAIQEFKNKKKAFTQELATLWNILTEAATDKRNSGNVICIIDGLDECEMVTQVQLIRSFVRFYQNETPNRNGPLLKLLVTSRPDRAIEKEFSNLKNIRLKVEDRPTATCEDIKTVVKAKVRCIGATECLSEDLQEDLVRRLFGKAEQTFLWVSLVLEMIDRSKNLNQESLNRILSTRPVTLDEMYEKILGQCPDIEAAKKNLHIVVAAARPLSLDEINVAFSIKPADRSFQNVDLETSIESTLKKTCRSFLRIQDSKVYIVHQTAKDFLMRNHTLNQVESNQVLAGGCLQCLLFDVFETDPPAFNHENYADQCTSENGFFIYAANHWADHFRRANAKEGAILQAALEVCDTKSRRFQSWFHLYWNTNHPYEILPEHLTDLLVGSYFGLDAMVKLLLEKKAEVDLKDASDRTPLLWAAKNGHDTVVRLLLEEKAEVDSKEASGRTPLSCAAENGHYTVVKLLLEWKAKVDLKDTNGQTPLLWAAENGHDTVVRLLLENDAEVDTNDFDERMPLSYAAENGHDTVVNLLVENNAKVDSEDSFRRTPLLWAAKNGHDTVVKLLLEKKAEADSDDLDGRTPLLWASKEGHDTVVKQLLENEAEVDSNDCYGRTPLLWAAENGHDAVVKLLLERGAKVNSKDFMGRTPLSWAAKNGHNTAIKLLLERKAEVDLKDVSGRIPLSWAAENGHEVVVNLLERVSNELL